MGTYHYIKITFQRTGGDESYLNGNSEIPNKILGDITRDTLLKTSHKK